jgi:hypothetical protein
MSIERFKNGINNLDKVRKSEIDLRELSWNAFLDEFDLLDPREFALAK